MQRGPEQHANGLRACFLPESGIRSPGSFSRRMAMGTGPGHPVTPLFPASGGRNGSQRLPEVVMSQNPASHWVQSLHRLRDHLHRTRTPRWGLGLEGEASCAQGQGGAPAPPWGLASSVVSRKKVLGFLG